MKIPLFKFKNDPFFEDCTITELNDLVIVIGSTGSGKTRFLREIHQILKLKPKGNLEVGIVINNSDGKSKRFNLAYIGLGTRFSWPRKIVNDFEESVIYIEMPTVIQNNLQPNFQASLGTIEQQNRDSQGRFNPSSLNDLLGAASINYLVKRSNEIEKEDLETEQIKRKHPSLITRINDSLSKILPYVEILEPDPSSRQLKCKVRGEIIDLELLSSGEYIILIIALEILSRNIHKGVLLIDEIEAHLHPDLQAKLIPFIMSLLGESRDEIQLWISTHSQAVLDPTSLAGIDYSIIHLSMEDNGKIVLNEVSNQAVDYPQSFFRLLGSSPFYGRKRILYIEGDTEEDILSTLFQRISDLRGVWKLERLGGCNQIIETIVLTQYLQEGPIKNMIPELDLIYGLLDNDNARTLNSNLKISDPNTHVYIWPFYHIENLIFCEPWKSFFIRSVQGSTGKSEADIITALEHAKNNFIQNQQSKKSDDKGRFVKDQTINDVISGKKNFMLVFPGRELFKEWINVLGTSQRGGLNIKDLIQKYIKDNSLELPQELQNIVEWLRSK